MSMPVNYLKITARKNDQGFEQRYKNHHHPRALHKFSHIHLHLLHLPQDKHKLRLNKKNRTNLQTTIMMILMMKKSWRIFQMAITMTQIICLVVLAETLADLIILILISSNTEVL